MSRDLRCQRCWKDTVECEVCKGDGRYDGHDCTECDGTGRKCPVDGRFWKR
jgi:DnaJ-class molecular chaperone